MNAFSEVIAELQTKMVWGVVGCSYADLPAVYHGPFTYPGGVLLNEFLVGVGGGGDARVVLDFEAMR